MSGLGPGRRRKTRFQRIVIGNKLFTSGSTFHNCACFFLLYGLYSFHHRRGLLPKIVVACMRDDDTCRSSQIIINFVFISDLATRREEFHFHLAGVQLHKRRCRTHRKMPQLNVEIFLRLLSNSRCRFAPRPHARSP